MTIPRPARFRSYNAAQAWHDAMLALSGKVDVRDKDQVVRMQNGSTITTVDGGEEIVGTNSYAPVDVDHQPQEECDIDPDEAVTEYKNRRGE